MANDIIEELKSKELEAMKELMEETEELLHFGSWSWEIETDIVTWTPGLYALLEHNPEQVKENTTMDLFLSHVQEEYRQNFRAVLTQALKDKTDFSVEYVIKTHSGVFKNISSSGKVIKDEQEKVLKILCINRDITSMRSFEKEQQRRIRELDRANKELEEFSYIASHDLQEPIRKVSMFTERLRAKYDRMLDKEGELFIERILASAASLRTLIDNLLDFSRVNRRSHSHDQVDLKSLLIGVTAEHNAEESNTSIEFTGTWPVVEAVTPEMKQLFGNIFSNAIKFRKSSGALQLNVHADKLSKVEKNDLGLPENECFYKIEVQDNGIGFESEYSEKIFQIFQRLNGKSEYPGSGIGLAICKKIVEKHNGLIFAKGKPDEGSTFTVILPEKQI